jgi:hypothetical protein
MHTRFYFNSEDDHTELDPEGIELTDMAHAQKEALGLLGRMLQDTTGDALWQGKNWRVWVSDAPNGAGHVFFNIQVSATTPTQRTD